LLDHAGYDATSEATGEDGMHALRCGCFRLVVLDVNLPGISGYELCREIREEFGEGIAILLVSGVRVESFDRVAGLRLGGDDYLVKPFAPDEFVARVDTLLRRTGATARSPLAAKLTDRELEVLRLLAEGLHQKEIADSLVLSPRTVGRHIEHILAKLGVHSRAQAVASAFRDGLLGRRA
jgi:DNA-binding NarL/FixJ family response regulator